MGQFSLNGTLSTCPDPAAYELEGTGEVGADVSGAPFLQGRESGTLVWDALTHAEFIELYAAWNTNKGSKVAGAIPQISTGSLGTYDSVTCYFHEPTARVSGKLWQNVRLRVTDVTR